VKEGNPFTRTRTLKLRHNANRKAWSRSENKGSRDNAAKLLNAERRFLSRQMGCAAPKKDPAIDGPCNPSIVQQPVKQLRD